jgi:hypothetical protein|tara:strand:+ start:94 stop:420 length:327 start_codon:yes stop_codon:yes gene_type:complete
MVKKLQPQSKYSQFDVDGDGVVTDKEIAMEKEMMELERQEEKAEAQKKMAWVAMVSMLGFTIFLFLPIIPDSRVSALAELLGLFYIGQASVVGAYMGFTAYMSKSKTK